MLFDEPTVAFRGPWNRTDLVKIAPLASDLRGRDEHHLDSPGDPLDAGCDFELWAGRVTTDSEPTVYAHVATEPGYPGKLALQSWFFYPFNDFNSISLLRDLVGIDSVSPKLGWSSRCRGSDG